MNQETKIRVLKSARCPMLISNVAQLDMIEHGTLVAVGRHDTMERRLAKTPPVKTAAKKGKKLLTEDDLAPGTPKPFVLIGENGHVDTLTQDFVDTHTPLYAYLK